MFVLGMLNTNTILTAVCVVAVFLSYCFRPNILFYMFIYLPMSFSLPSFLYSLSLCILRFPNVLTTSRGLPILLLGFSHLSSCIRRDCSCHISSLVAIGSVTSILSHHFYFIVIIFFSFFFNCFSHC